MKEPGTILFTSVEDGDGVHAQDYILSCGESAVNEKGNIVIPQNAELRALISTSTKNVSLLDHDESDDLEAPSLTGVSEDTSCMGSICSGSSSNTSCEHVNKASSDNLQLTPQTPTTPFTCDSIFWLADLLNFFDKKVSTPSQIQSSSSCISRSIPEECQLDSTSADHNFDECLHQEHDDEIEDLRNDIQSNILSMIGCPASSAESWETLMDHLLCNLCIKELNESTTTPQSQDYEVPKLRNRSSYDRDNALKRIQQLRKSGLGKEFSLAHISNLLKEDLKMTNPHMIMPSRSFDLKLESEINRHLSLPRRNECPTFLNRFIFRQKIEAIPSVDSEEHEIELFYDSDPGHLLKRENHGHESIHLPLPCAGGLRETSRAVSCPVTSTVPHKKILPTLDMSTFPMNDTAIVLDLIHDMILNDVDCVLHPSVATKQKHPLMVTAWFEMGSCVKSTLIQPRFVWRPLPSGLSNRRNVISALQKPQGIDLLDIVRIVKARSDLDRLTHSFVKLSHSFAIITNTGEEHLFEVASEEERDKFVFAFKILIARLASKIIVGDKGVFEEFFTPQSKKVRSKRYKPVSSISSRDSSQSLSTMLVSPVHRESNRHDELWGVYSSFEDE